MGSSVWGWQTPSELSDGGAGSRAAELEFEFMSISLTRGLVIYPSDFLFVEKEKKHLLFLFFLNLELRL